MSDPICQLMEDIEGLCKRCYYLQKSNNEMYDYLKDDRQMQEHIDENERILEKYHRKINEIVQLIKEHSSQETALSWSPTAIDYKRMEELEKKASDEKKYLFVKSQMNNEQVTSEDKGVYL